MSENTKEIKIIFMGTPEFAGFCLEKLIENGFNIIAVVTVADKKSGRGQKISSSPVKEIALKNNLPVLQPTNLQSDYFIQTLHELKPDLFIVVAFRMLPKIIWQMPQYGTFNLHASLLPDYRGAAPINHAIMNGEKITGLTTFFIDEKIDTGNIVLRKEIEISEEDDFQTLHDKMKSEGAELIIQTINIIGKGNLKLIKQSDLMSPNQEIKSASKIFPENCFINWLSETEKIYNFVRGLSPYPCARTILTDKENGKEILFKILKTKKIFQIHNYKNGTIISDNKKFIQIACNEGFIEIEVLQPEGKKVMNTKEFLNGFDITGYLIKI